MKALADLNRRQISTSLTAVPLSDEDFDYNSPTLRKPLRHRLHAVTPLETPHLTDAFSSDEGDFARTARSTVATNMVIRPTFNSKAKSERMTTPKLTTEEFIQVRLATVRESTRHCYWPSDVVARFAAADVIR